MIGQTDSNIITTECKNILNHTIICGILHAEKKQRTKNDSVQQTAWYGLAACLHF